MQGSATDALFAIVLGGAIVLAGSSFDVAAQQSPEDFAFQPKIVTILGSHEPGDAEAFTRIFNQNKGELAIRNGGFKATGGFTIDWIKVAQALLQPEPVLGHMTQIVGTDVIHMVIRPNFARSNLFLAMVAVEFIVSEGTTLPIPVGTLYGGEFWRAIPGGIVGDQGYFTPGLLPDIHEHAFTLSYFIVPGIIRNPPHRARIDIEYEFISTQPPDGSDQRVAMPSETLLISRSLNFNRPR